MAEPILANAQSNDVIYTTETRVACGGPAEGPHPKVYLTLEKADNGEVEVVCPYCSRIFRHDDRMREYV